MISPIKIELPIHADQPMTDLQALDDGTIKVCIEEEGYRHCGFVSSHHLVDVKAQQLRHFIRGSQRQVPPESDL